MLVVVHCGFYIKWNHLIMSCYCPNISSSRLILLSGVSDIKICKRAFEQSNILCAGYSVAVFQFVKLRLSEICYGPSVTKQRSFASLGAKGVNQ